MSRTPSREEALFADVLAQPPAQRGAFLGQACGADTALLARIASLIAAHDGPESLMVSPAFARPVLTPEEKSGDAIGHYKLLQKIGEGGCGMVWMAEQEEPVRRRVALKVIKLGMDTKAVVARFEAERQALAMMDHPCIAKVHDAGSTDTGRPYFVMELVRGIPITKYCDENHLTPNQRLELFIKVCQAIQHAHQKGVIHRDIKPSNILVTVNDGAPTPKVIDFGIAKATQGKLTDATVFTAFEQFIGTPVYMSPEQAEMSSLDIDTRSDIYSLGVLLYELLTGRPPFDPKAFAQAGVDEIRHHIREDEPPTPSRRLHTLDDTERTTIARLRGTVPAQLTMLLRGDLDWIVMRCLEKDRTRRYETANGLAMDIQRHLRNEPVVARPPSTAYLLQKLIRRHRVGFVATTAIVAAILLGAIVSTWQALRATGAEREQSRLRSESETAREAERVGRQRAEVAEVAARQAEKLAALGRMKAENLLSFVFTDLGEQLSDFGHLPILRQVSDRAISYYESLPPELRSRETQASYALALAGVGALGWIRSDTSAQTDYGLPTARPRLEKAVNIFEELEAAGPLTPLMRVASAGVYWATTMQYYGEAKYLEAARVADRGEKAVEPALADEQWGGWAQRQLTKLIWSKAFSLAWAGKHAEAVPEYQRAIASAEVADRRPPLTTRVGLRVAQIRTDYQEALRAIGRRAEANEINLQARKQLRQFVEREPFLVTAKWSLAMAARSASAVAFSNWEFGEVKSAIDEIIQEFDELIRLDPKTWAYQGYIAYAWAGTLNWSRFQYHRAMGDIGAAERAARKGVEYWTVDWAPPEGWRFQMMGRFNLARISAALGANTEAELQLAEIERLRRRIIEHQDLKGAGQELHAYSYHDSRRDVEFQRLNWRGIHKNVEELLSRLERLPAGQEASAVAQGLRRNAARDRMRAAFEMHDHVTARRELDIWSPDINRLPDTATLLQRFNHVTNQLTRIHVLGRSDERENARNELVAWWPEVESLFIAGAEYHFNRVQTAQALSIRAEFDGDDKSKRGWLERAAGYLRPAAAAGQLTRYEREVLLAGVEKQLAGLDGTNAR